MKLIIAAVLGVLLLLVAAVLQTSPMQRRVQEWAGEYLRSAQDIDLQAAGLRYNLFALTADLEGVVLRRADKPDAPPFLELDSAHLNLAFPRFWAGELTIKELRLKGVRIHIVQAEGDAGNLPKSLTEAGEESEGGPGLGVLVSSLDLEDGSLVLEQPDSQFSASLPRWSVRARGDPQTFDHTVRLETAGAGAIRWNEQHLPVDGISADVRVGAGGLDLNRLDIRSGGSRLAASGDWKEFADLGLLVSTAVVLPEVAAFAVPGEPIEGRLAADFTVNGPLEDLRIGGTVSGRDVAFRSFGGMEFTGKGEWAGDRVTLSAFDVESPQVAMSAGGALALNDEGGESTVEARIRRASLAALSRELDLPIMLASNAAGRVRARWNGLEWKSAAGETDLRLGEAGSLAKGRLPVSGRLRATMEGGRADIVVEQLTALGAALDGSIEISDFAALGGQLNVEASETETLAAGIATVFEQAEPAPLGGGLRLTASLGGTLEEPAVGLQAEAPALRYGDLEGVGLTLAASYTPDLLGIERIRIAWRGQSLTTGGAIGLGGPSPALDVTASARGVSASAILRGLGHDAPVTADADLDAVIRGTVAEPVAEISLATGPWQAYGERGEGISLEAEYGSNELHLNSLRVAKGSGALAASGWYNHSSRAYSVEVESGNLELTGLELPGGTPVRGVLALRASGDGTVDDPTLSLDFSARGAKVDGRELGDFLVKGGVANQRASLELNAPALALAATLHSGIRDPFPASFQFSAEGTDLAVAQFSLGEDLPVTGQLSIQANGAGNLADLTSGQAAVTVSDLRLQAGGQEIRNDGPIEAGFRDRNLRVGRAALTTGDSRVSIAGRLPLDRQDPASGLEAEAEIQLADILRFVPDPAGLEASGRLQVNARVTGTLQQPEPSAEVRSEGVSLRHPALTAPVEDVELAASFANQSVELKRLGTRLGEGTLNASGVIPIEKGGEATLTVDAANLDLRALTAMPEEAQGALGFHAEVRTPSLDDFTAADGTLRFDTLRLQYADLTLNQADPVQVSVQNGAATIDSFRLTGPETSVEAGGSVSLLDPQTIDLRASGKLDASVFTLVAKDLIAAGPSRFELAVTGPASAPELTGFFEMEDGQVGVSEPSLLADDLDVKIDLSPDRITVSKLTGLLNGGPLSASGSAGYSGEGLQEIDLRINARDAFMEFPEGLNTRVRADLNIRDTDGRIEVGGKVNVVDGAYREPIELSGGIFGFLQSSGGVELTGEPDPLLSRIRFNIEVHTDNPVLVENNLMELSVHSDLRLTGSYYQPGLLGRVSLDEGGELYLNERRYFIDRGNVSFVNDRDIKPDLDIVAKTRASSYDITLRLTGGAEDYSAEFSSDPPLSQPDIVSVLLTGRTLEQAGGAGSEIAQEQALAFLSGSAASRLSRFSEETFGLSQVRIEPSLISPESDPTARLTIAQEFTDFLRFIHSMNLRDSSDQIQVLEWDVIRRFIARSTRQRDNTYRFDFEHGLSFGGGDQEGSGGGQEKQRIGAVSFDGDLVLPEKTVEDKLGLDAGDKYNFFKTQKRADRLRKLYWKEDHLEARVRLSREEEGDKVDVNLNVQAGPKVEFQFEGYDVPGDVRSQIARAWHEGFADVQRLRDSSTLLRDYLISQGYLEPKLEHEIAGDAGTKSVRFRIEPGVRYARVETVFDGAAGIEPDELRQALRDQDLLAAMHVAPKSVADFLRGYYREQGYLEAEVQLPRRELDASSGTGRVVIPIEEGPLFRCGAFAFEGNKAFASEQLAASLPLVEGDPCRPARVLSAVDSIRETYWSRGYNDVEVQYALKRDVANGAADILFRITENQQEVVGEISVDGARVTNERLARGQLELSQGDVLSFRQTAKSRRNLYDIGAYSMVDIRTRPLDGPLSEPARVPMALDVALREVKPYSLRYGASYDTDRGPGFIVDFANQNTLGAARTIGVRGRYDPDFRELRGFFSQPLLRRLPLKTGVVGFTSREIFDTFITDRTGFSVQQQVKFLGSNIINYGYRFERTDTFDKDPDSLFQVPPFNLAPLTISWTRETRDDFLDAARGSLISQAFEYAPSGLGSDLQFWKYFGQYFKYVPLSQPQRVPFTNGARKNRLVYAGAVRAGLAAGLGGQDLIRTERFFAGGGTTLRGFEKDSVGPSDFFGVTGGDAVFITNQELRFPIYHMFDGVGFLDIGNVYSRVEDFDPLSVRKSSGFGLRVRTPYFLLRLDYGFILDRKPGEPRGGFFFSIGQAF